MLLFKVEQQFEIAGRGTVLVADRDPEHGKVRTGDSVVLKLPDGGEIATQVSGVELIRRTSGTCVLGILLTDIRKSQAHRNGGPS